VTTSESAEDKPESEVSKVKSEPPIIQHRERKPPERPASEVDAPIWIFKQV